MKLSTMLPELNPIQLTLLENRIKEEKIKELEWVNEDVLEKGSGLWFYTDKVDNRIKELRLAERSSHNRDKETSHE